MARAKPPYRDGQVHVLSRQCATCVLRPGNLMRLQQGRLKNLIETNRRKDTALTCHDTLDGERAICRGYFDAYWQEVTPLRMAVAFHIIKEVSPPT